MKSIQKILFLFLIISLTPILYPERVPARSDSTKKQEILTPQQLLARGKEFHNRGDLEQAAHSFEQSRNLLNPEQNSGDYLDATMLLAELYMALGYHQRALARLNGAVPLIKASDDRYRNALFLNTLADVHLSLGNMQEMVKFTLSAVKEARLAKNDRILARVLNNLGNVLAVDTRYQEALVSYGECLSLLNDSREDLTLKSKVLINITRASFLGGDYESAVSALEHAISQVEKLPDSHHKATGLIALSTLAESIRDKLHQALKKVEPEDNLTFLFNPSDVDNKVRVDIPQGFTLQKHKAQKRTLYFDFASASLSEKEIKSLQEQIELMQISGANYFYIDIKGFTDSIGIRKSREKYKNNFELSKRRTVNVAQTLEKLLPDAELIKRSKWKFIYSLLIGTFADKIDALREAKKLEEKYNVKTVVNERIFFGKRDYLLYAGECKSEEEARELAGRFFGVEYHVQAISSSSTSELKTKYGRVFIYKEAKGSLPSATEDTPPHLGSSENRRVEIKMIALSSQKKKLGARLTGKTEMNSRTKRIKFKSKTATTKLEAEALYEKDILAHLAKIAHQSLKAASRIGITLQDNRIASHALGRMGRQLEEEKRYAEAVRVTRQAIVFATKENCPEILYLWQWQMGRLHKANGDMASAIKSYSSAIETLDPVHQKLLKGYRSQKAVFDKDIKPVYLELTELFLNQAESMQDSASREHGLRQARDTMELLKAFELQDFFQDECVIKETKKITFDRSPPHTTIIYPIALPDRLVLLLILPDGMRQTNAAVDSETLKRTITRFRERLQTRTDNRFLHEARLLYDWVIRPIEAELAAQDVDTLIVAPDGALRLIPFSTLHDGKQFLVEKYALATIPAITLTNPKPIDHKDTSILIGGLSEAVQGFTALPSVPSELLEIKRTMNGKMLLQDKQLNMDDLKREFKDNAYSIVHIATHGTFGGTPEETYLLTYDEKLDMDRLEQLIGLSKYRKNKVELLVLSACQTALGDERAALGLAGLAVKAGVRSALATLWFVDDEATAFAISEFYRQLKTPGISRAKALQNTQKKLINQARYWHPLYWAPFLLIGSWM